jgi:SAM-dependent methyltransferase
MKPAYFAEDLEAMSYAANYRSWIIDEFRPFLGKHVVEVGGGTGDFSHLLLHAARISRLVIFEPSINTYTTLQQRFQNIHDVEIFNCVFEEKYERYKTFFDTVLYVNVLEHIENEEKELSLARASLKSNGHLLVFVPALNFLFSDLDSKLGHFRRYNKKALANLVKRSGFEIVSLKYLDSLGIIPWWFVFVLLKRTLTGGKVSLYDKVVVPTLRKVEGIVAPPIGKNLLLIARKP